MKAKINQFGKKTKLIINYISKSSDLFFINQIETFSLEMNKLVNVAIFLNK